MKNRTIKCPRCGMDIVQELKTTNELLKELEQYNDEAANDMRADLLEVKDKDVINYDYADLEYITCSNCDYSDIVENMQLFWKENKNPFLVQLLNDEVEE